MNRRILASEFGTLIWKILRFFIIIGLSYVLVYPILYMASMAFRTVSDVVDPSVVWIPKHFTLEHFTYAWEQMKYLSCMSTTLIMSIVGTVLQMISCSMVGYGLARFKFRSSGFWFVLVLRALIVPAEAVTIPLYFQYKSFSIPILSPILQYGFGILMPEFLTVNLIDSWFVFWLTAITATGLRSGLYVYIFRNFFLNIPYEIEEAAVVDGASYFKTFTSIMVPNAGGSYLTVFLFSIVWYWNDTFYTSTFISDKITIAKSLSMLSSATAKLSEADATPKLLAGALLYIAPMMLMYMVLQRYFVQSVERTGIVG